jgi:hypothetical protein
MPSGFFAAACSSGATSGDDGRAGNLQRTPNVSLEIDSLPSVPAKAPQPALASVRTKAWREWPELRSSNDGSGHLAPFGPRNGATLQTTARPDFAVWVPIDSRGSSERRPDDVIDAHARVVEDRPYFASRHQFHNRALGPFATAKGDKPAPIRRPVDVALLQPRR